MGIFVGILCKNLITFSELQAIKVTAKPKPERSGMGRRLTERTALCDTKIQVVVVF